MKKKSVEVNTLTEHVYEVDPTVQFDKGEVSLFYARGNMLMPFEYDLGWRQETNSWKETCYINFHPISTPTYRFWGPDALQFISDNFVNGVKKFMVGTGKHGIMCNE